MKSEAPNGSKGVPGYRGNHEPHRPSTSQKALQRRNNCADRLFCTAERAFSLRAKCCLTP